MVVRRSDTGPQVVNVCIISDPSAMARAISGHWYPRAGERIDLSVYLVVYSMLSSEAGTFIGRRSLIRGADSLIQAKRRVT
jgi:hypothetical protein